MGFDIRIVTIGGEPWFVAADVCRALGLKDAAGSYTHHLKALLAGEQRLTSITDLGAKRVGRGGANFLKLVSEPGMYRLVMRSDKPQARPFQDWVTQDVLPTIRKTGSYVMGEEKLKQPGMSLNDINDVNDLIQEMLQRKAALLEARVAELKAANDAMAPKAALVDAHYAQSNLISINKFARTLSGVNVNRVKGALATGLCPQTAHK